MGGFDLGASVRDSVKDLPLLGMREEIRGETGRLARDQVIEFRLRTQSPVPYRELLILGVRVESRILRILL